MDEANHPCCPSQLPKHVIMATRTFAATALEFEPYSNIQSPPPALQKAPTAVELDSLTFGTRYNGPPTQPRSPMRGNESPRNPNDLESNPPTPTRSSSPQLGQSMAVVQSLKSPAGNLYRFINICMISLVMGINDSLPGALLPYIEDYYHITYGTVSLLFVANAIGFVSAAPFTHFLQSKLGRAGILTLAEILVTLGYVMIVIRPPFPVVVISFYFSGLGAAWALAVNNVLVAGLTNATSLLVCVAGLSSMSDKLILYAGYLPWLLRYRRYFGASSCNCTCLVRTLLVRRLLPYTCVGSNQHGMRVLDFTPL